MTMKWMKKVVKFSRQHRSGGSTVEFVIILPLFLMMAFFVFQFAIAGLAIMDTQAALRDAVRVASVTGDKEKAIQQGKASFGGSGFYRLSQFDITFYEDKVVAKAHTKIDVLFMSSNPFDYDQTAEAPIVK